MTCEIFLGDCIEVMSTLRNESIDCIVTSPPYYCLRDYDTEGQIGLEATPREYVAKLVSVFREAKRLLVPHGSLWLNLGDTYAGYHGNKNSSIPSSAVNGWVRGTNENKRKSTVNVDGLKQKDLIGIPWMVAFALRDDGWYLRSDVIWDKCNPAPEPRVKDRPTRSHEYMFLLTKSRKYYYDKDGAKAANGGRSVWSVPKAGQSFSAAFPEKLITPCIIAGSPVGGYVLDPFSGTGTTGQVCKSLERNYVGIELNRKSYRKSVERIIENNHHKS